jgi:hypothetical protein
MPKEELLPDTVSGRKILADIDELREWFEGRLGKTHREWIAEIRAVEAEARAPLETQITEKDASFDLRWKADMRAIKAWQTKTGRTEVWPDHVDLVLWLLEQRDTSANKS